MTSVYDRPLQQKFSRPHPARTALEIFKWHNLGLACVVLVPAWVKWSLIPIAYYILFVALEWLWSWKGKTQIVTLLDYSGGVASANGRQVADLSQVEGIVLQRRLTLEIKDTFEGFPRVSSAPRTFTCLKLQEGGLLPLCDHSDLNSLKHRTFVWPVLDRQEDLRQPWLEWVWVVLLLGHWLAFVVASFVWAAI
jgi:hypothetical protein